MKRPPQSWLLPMLGILFLLHCTNSLRATSLIFGKTTTTTTTTEAPTEEEAVTTSSETSQDGVQNVTKPPLTGIPQIDYIWDPNLPRELNGFNLTDYPFYETIPKEIDFKCDGLHDGFYASVPHKCQVYHHCLYGTRYDFLCANFTAFDQKTFICHFVSEVDCVNSPKYFHRNDALYVAATTTTLTPPTTRTTVPPPPARRPAAPGLRRRPLRRRRPQYDYYEEYDEYETDRGRDDYYDEPRYQATEPPRSDGRNRRRKRPRPSNRRPEYEEYDEYEDERFDRRGSGRRDEDRRPYDRRPAKKDSRRDDPKYDDEEPVREDRRKTTEDRRRPAEDEYERRPYNRKSSRRPAEDDRDDRRTYDRRKEERPLDDKDDRRPVERPRKDDSDRRYRPKEPKVEEPEEPRRYRPKEKAVEKEEPKALVRPSSGSSVYDRPRAPPIIRRPVPKTERDKFDYKPTAAAKPVKSLVPADEEYYDDYEDEAPKAPPPKTTRKPVVQEEPIENDRKTNFRSRRPQNRPLKQDVEEPKRSQKDFESRNPPKRLLEDSEEIRKPSKVLPVDDIEDIRRPAKRPLDSIESVRRAQKRPLDEQVPRRGLKRPLDDVDDVRRPQKRPIDDADDLRRPQSRPIDDVEDVRRPLKRPADDSEELRRPAKRPLDIRSRYETERVPSGSQKHRVVDEDFIEDDYEDDKSISKEEVQTIVRPAKYSPRDRSPEVVKVPEKEIRERPEPVVRVVKRPFLPSRGGNPYVARGLQPIGAKALDTSEKVELNDAPSRSSETSRETKSQGSRENPTSSEEQYEYEEEEPLPPVKTSRKEDPSIEDIFKPVTTRPKTDFRQNFRSESPLRPAAEPKTTTQKPKQAETYRNPLDINENEYDVTLNDALNPTIPNLPIRSLPTGFGAGRDPYSNTNYQRPRFIAIDAPIASASSDYVYQIKEPQIKLQEASSNPGYATYVRSQATGYQGHNYRHPSTAAGHYYTTF